MPGPGPVTRFKRRRFSINRPDGSQTAGPAHSDCPQYLQQFAECSKAAEMLSEPEKTSNNIDNRTPGSSLEGKLSSPPPPTICIPSSIGSVPSTKSTSSAPAAAGSMSQLNIANGGEVPQPTRVMRCAVPVRSIRSSSPAACSSTSQCGILNCGEAIQPARVMRCALPARSAKGVRLSVSESACPAAEVQCEDTPHSFDTQNQTTNSVVPAPSIKSTFPCLPCDDFEPPELSGQINNIFGSKPFKDEAQQIETTKVSSKNVLEGVAEPEILKCRVGQSSYSLRALKTVPMYNDNIYGITYSSKSIKYDRKKNRKIETNNNSSDDHEDNHSYKSASDDSFINLLPDEILSMIFSYLSHVDLLRICSRVCHRWLSVAMCPNLWHSLSFVGQDIPIEIVCGCIRLTPMLKSITIKDRHDIDVILPILHQQCKRLESVNLVRCRPCDATKRNILAKSLYPFLRKSQLRNLNLKGTDYRSRKFYQMLSALPNFRKLNISCSKSVTPQILSEIAKHTNLKVFKNKWHSHSVYHGPKSMTIQLPGKIDEWVNAYSLLFKNAGKNLTTFEFYAAGISDSALSGLANCKKLKKLFAYNANCFGGESMAAVASLTELQELLIHNAKLTKTDVVKAFQTCNLAGLKCLHLNNSILSNGPDDVSADACLRKVAERCCYLRHLSFTNCSTVTDEGVQAVLTYCPNLVSLDLNGALGVNGKVFLLIPKFTLYLKHLVIEEVCLEETSEIVKTLTEKHGISVDSVSTWKHRSTSYLL